jgi:hypothetical protein
VRLGSRSALTCHSKHLPHIEGVRPTHLARRRRRAHRRSTRRTVRCPARRLAEERLAFGSGYGWAMSRPLEVCEGCAALAGVRKLGVDDPGVGRPDSHCNSDGRRIRACRAATARSVSPSSGPDLSPKRSRPVAPGLVAAPSSLRVIRRRQWGMPETHGARISDAELDPSHITQVGAGF